MRSRRDLTSALSHVDEAELVELTRDLVRIPSVVRPGDPEANESDVAEYVHRWLVKEGFEVELQPVAPGRPNVIASLVQGRPDRTLLLEGHTDVVTEGDATEWRHSPFAADLDQGRIWGRGAADMKGGLAAAMIAAAAIRRSGARFRGRLVVGALVDEEADMMGARHFCETRVGREVTAAIICEPEQNELCLEQRGVVWARVTARGRMAHGAMPEAGVNPIAALAALISETPKLERRLRQLCRRSRHLAPPTVTATSVRAPVYGVAQSNVIPSSARLTLDVRLTPGAEEAAVRAMIDAACREAEARVPGAALEWEPVNGFRLPTVVDAHEPLVRAMVAGVKQATGRRPVFGGVPGSTDGTILRMARGIPIVTCGPGRRLVPHQVDEYVDIAELLEAARVYVASALNYLEP